MKKIKNTNGITLIALVITIIVLLILAGVAIATLTGENGVLSQAEKSGDQTEIAEAIERAKLDIIAWQTEKEANNEDATLTDSVIQGILTGKDYVEGDPGTKSFVSTTGHTISYADLYESPMTITEAKELENGFDKNTILVDEFGNTVKVPEGFKIASDSATNVTGGVVIEDATDEATVGSQFVWIPVGKVYINEEQTDYETIELKRYVFDSDGVINEDLTKTEPTDELRVNSVDDATYFTEGLKDEVTTNTHAKDIKTFILTAESSHGYYIGRYEARANTTEPRTSPTKNDEELPQITVKPNDYVYNYVTQSQAAKLSQEMYSNENFISDLVNSYAWDTAIVFIQTFDDRTSKTREYSRQNALNYGQDLAEKGTNNIIDTQYQDEVCKIWDMASNCVEFTTETYGGPDYPGTRRGGYCNNSNSYTSYRGYISTVYSYPDVVFRLLLYL